MVYNSSSAFTRNFTVQCRIRVPNPPPPPPLRPCNAAFSFRPDTGLAVRFAPAVVDTLWTYRWSFGDGNLSTQVSPAHTYASGGMYTVRLVVTRLSTTAGAACSDTESRVVNVPMPPRPPISNPWSIPCNPRFGARVDTTLTVQFRSVCRIRRRNIPGILATALPRVFAIRPIPTVRRVPMWLFWRYPAQAPPLELLAPIPLGCGFPFQVTAGPGSLPTPDLFHHHLLAKPVTLLRPIPNLWVTCSRFVLPWLE